MTTLTPRQLEILRLSADGLTCHAIGRKLFVSENTVRSHRKAAIKRLGAATTAHAVTLAFKQGILATPEVESRIAELNGKLGAKCGEVVELHRQVASAQAWAVHFEQESAALSTLLRGMARRVGETRRDYDELMEDRNTYARLCGELVLKRRAS